MGICYLLKWRWGGADGGHTACYPPTRAGAVAAWRARDFVYRAGGLVAVYLHANGQDTLYPEEERPIDCSECLSGPR